MNEGFLFYQITFKTVSKEYYVSKNFKKIPEVFY